MADRTQDRIGAPGSLEELQRELAGALVPSSVEELQRQFAAALEQQAATARILEVINRSAGDLEPVYQAVLDAAQRLLLADSASLHRVVDAQLETVAVGGGVNLAPGVAVGQQIEISVRTVAGTAVLERQTVHVPDVRKEPQLPQNVPWARLAVPIIHGEGVVGVITVAHHEAVPFTPRQISLLETFAGQVGIAIENARLLNETKEALERQTAVSDVLSSISQSPGEIGPVIETVMRRAMTLCDAHDVLVLAVEGEEVRPLGHVGPVPTGEPRTIKVADTPPAAARAVRERRTIHIRDLLEYPEDEYATGRKRAAETGVRTALAVPLLRKGGAIGAIILRRQEVRPFADTQIALLETFADQAAIAIENVRLFNETKEALEQQTATAEVLKVISGSTSDIHPVLEAVVAAAGRLVRADAAWLRRGEGLGRGAFAYWTATSELGEHLAKSIQQIVGPNPPDRSLMGLVIKEGRTIHIPDVTARDDLERSRIATAVGTRTALATPMLKGGTILGYLVVARTSVEPFTDREVALVESFADQAVIAIENVRLFNETQEALERQTALGEILRVIAASPSDIQPVLDAIAESVARFCAAEDATVMIVRDSALHPAAHHGPLATIIERPMAPLDRSLPIESSSVSGRAVLELRIVQVDDILTEKASYPRTAERAQELGYRSMVAAPLIGEGRALGTILLRRAEPAPFTPKQVELLRTFADQAVIAMENVRLFNETKEALVQQTATADVLKVISRSAFDLDAVFENLLQNAVTICNADWGSIQRAEGDGVRNVAQVGGSAAFREVNERTVYRPGRDTSNGRALLEKRPIHIHDLAADPEYKFTAAVELGGIRTNLVVPMLRDDKVVGTFGLSRNEVRPFSEKEIALVSTFADQAAIAIENVRLFNETKEALDRQTAVGGILRAISESPTDVGPVLDTIAESAARFCSAEDATLLLVDGEVVRTRAHHGPVPLRTQLAMEFPLTRGTVTGRSILERRTVHVADLQAETDEEYPIGKEQARRMGHRATLAAPLIREGVGVGAILLRRMEARPFTEHQLDLVRTFADQAVIAIENVRLFNETRESLERQTATSEVLRSISGSAFETGPVFETILDQSLRLCDAEDAMVVRAENGGIRVVAHRGPVDIDAARLYPMTRGLIAARAVIDDATVHVRDMLAEPADFPESYELATTYGFRSTLATPLRRQGGPVGAILIRRRDIRPFSPEQIRLLETFADQAVIAIENVRLFNETKEALEQQAATARVLQVISRSAFDLGSALETLVEEAARLCAADQGSIHRWDGTAYRTAAIWGPSLSEEYKREGFESPRYPGRDTLVGRTALEREVVHVIDATIDPEYKVQYLQKLGGYRTMLGVPLMRDGFPIGVFALMRNEVSPFTERQIELVRTFADQAAIAMENVRLFNETREALEQQTAMSEILRVISSSPTDVQPVLDAIAESAMRFCAAEHAIVNLTDGSIIRPVAGHFSVRDPFPLDRTTVTGRSMVDVRTQSIPDLADPRNAAEFPLGQAQAVRSGERAIVATPLIHDGRAIGSIVLWRTEPVEFTDKQIQLVETFARQAVIAIENVRLFNEIQNKSRQLEVASRHKSEFLANMSHELRTPLNAIIGFTDVMLEEMFGPLNDKQKEYLEDVRNSGTHLLTLINDILDLSKIEAGRIELEIAEFSFPDALENALTLVRERATRHGISLAADVAGDVGRIMADERKVKQVLVNLLANAVKFTPDGGRVTVKARRLNGEIEVAVHDTGIGVATEDQERIFDEFQQVGRDPERSREGTGLGLTLAKRFVELHGGRIWVESEVAKGSTFTFAIPVAQTALAGAKA